MFYVYILMTIYYLIGLQYFFYIYLNKKKYNHILIYLDEDNDNNSDTYLQNSIEYNDTELLVDIN